jgi:hypothetical protein
VRLIASDQSAKVPRMKRDEIIVTLRAHAPELRVVLIEEGALRRRTRQSVDREALRAF